LMKKWNIFIDSSDLLYVEADEIKVDGNRATLIRGDEVIGIWTLANICGIHEVS